MEFCGILHCTCRTALRTFLESALALLTSRLSRARSRLSSGMGTPEDGWEPLAPDGASFWSPEDIYNLSSMAFSILQSREMLRRFHSVPSSPSYSLTPI